MLENVRHSGRVIGRCAESDAEDFVLIGSDNRKNLGARFDVLIHRSLNAKLFNHGALNDFICGVGDGRIESNKRRRRLRFRTHCRAHLETSSKRSSRYSSKRVGREEHGSEKKGKDGKESHANTRKMTRSNGSFRKPFTVRVK